MQENNKFDVNRLIELFKSLGAVEIFGFMFSVVWSDSIALNGEYHGHINYNPHQITLSRTRSDRELIHTIIHETLHGIDQYGKVKDGGECLTDREIDRITTGLLTVVFHVGGAG